MFQTSTAAAMSVEINYKVQKRFIPQGGAVRQRYLYVNQSMASDSDLNFVASSGHFGHVAHDVFGSNSFSGAALAADTQRQTSRYTFVKRVCLKRALSPAYLMMTHWFSLSIIMFLYMLSASA